MNTKTLLILLAFILLFPGLFPGKTDEIKESFNNIELYQCRDNNGKLLPKELCRDIVGIRNQIQQDKINNIKEKKEKEYQRIQEIKKKSSENYKNLNKEDKSLLIQSYL